MLSISVVIPVLNQLSLTDNLLSYISSNLVKPGEVILIDNNSTEDVARLALKYKDLNISYLKQNKNIGVNASWNLGIGLSKGSLISILNNDIIITKYFFKHIQGLMTEHSKVGICVPVTVLDKHQVLMLDSEPYIKMKTLGKREGWAFTIRSNIAKDFIPIPFDVKTFFGDDYLFESTRRKGFDIVKMVTNPIFHYGSVTLDSAFGSVNSTDLLREERKIWDQLRLKIWKK